jgi:hypothetical protein
MRLPRLPNNRRQTRNRRQSPGIKPDPLEVP